MVPIIGTNLGTSVGTNVGTNVQNEAKNFRMRLWCHLSSRSQRGKMYFYLAPGVKATTKIVLLTHKNAILTPLIDTQKCFVVDTTHIIDT